MGNHNANAVAPNQPDQNQQLIQNQDPVDVSLLVEQPSFKKVFAIKNPIYLKKDMKWNLLSPDFDHSKRLRK